jgi:hypothetical protein
MSDQSFSEIVDIIGAFLYLRSISAVRGQSVFWNGLIFTAITSALAWLEKHGWSYFGM